MLAIRSEAYPEPWVLYFVVSVPTVHHYYRDGVSGANSSPVFLGKMFDTTSARWSPARSTKGAAALLLFDAGVTTSGSDMNLIVDNRSARSSFGCTQYGYFYLLRALSSKIAQVLGSEQLSPVRKAEGFFSKHSSLVKRSARRIPTGKGVK